MRARWPPCTLRARDGIADAYMALDVAVATAYGIREKKVMMSKRIRCAVVAGAALMGGGCATIVNDPMIPVEFIPQGCAALECTAKNKRGSWDFSAPGTVMIRRSDDALNLSCRRADGETFTTSVRSEMEGAKLMGSVVFFDLGITDSITDKHRIYASQVLLACG